MLKAPFAGTLQEGAFESIEDKARFALSIKRIVMTWLQNL
jgi:hypothetical protein